MNMMATQQPVVISAFFSILCFLCTILPQPCDGFINFQGNKVKHRDQIIAMQAQEQEAASPRVVICGGGIIGASIAYHLALEGVGAKIIESVEVASAASGKAAGFLALDWNDRLPIKELSRKSFEIHEQLASTLPEDCGYRRCNVLSAEVTEHSSGPPDSRRRKGSEASWLDGDVRHTRKFAGESSTAQVHPKLLTRALVAAAERLAGASVQIGKVVGVEKDAEGRACGVRLADGSVEPCDVVVAALGAWSSTAAFWDGASLPTITGQGAHSLTMTPTDPGAITNHCLFLSYQDKDGERGEPEVYPRPGGEVYLCAYSAPDVSCGTNPEEQTPPRPEDMSYLRRLGSALSSTLGEGAKINAEQQCFLPYAPDGKPVIGPIPGIPGSYIATGHGCWGILMGPATGAAMAELILHGKSEVVDLTPFSPSRFET